MISVGAGAQLPIADRPAQPLMITVAEVRRPGTRHDLEAHLEIRHPGESSQDRPRSAGKHRRHSLGMSTPAPKSTRWSAGVEPADVVDLFVYVVMLNLAAEYMPLVITETFTLSLLTSVLLKLVLEVVVAIKDRVKARFKAAQTPAGKVVAGLSLWLLLVGSKFVVLKLVALFFGETVSLGSFWSVTALILVLMLARAGVRRLLEPSEE